MPLESSIAWRSESVSSGVVSSAGGVDDERGQQSAAVPGTRDATAAPPTASARPEARRRATRNLPMIATSPVCPGAPGGSFRGALTAAQREPEPATGLAFMAVVEGCETQPF